MKELSVSIQTSGWYNPYFGGDNNPLEAFTKLKEYGFDAIDYNIDTKYPSGDIRAGKFNDFYAQDIDTLLEYYRPIKDALEKSGIAVAQAHAPFPIYVPDNAPLYDFLIEVVDKCCAICKYLGCPAIVVHPWTNPKDKENEIEVNLEMYRRMIPTGKKYGVKICLENMIGWTGTHAAAGACANMYETNWYIDTLNAEAGEDIFGFCYDIGHANITGNNIYQDIVKLGHRLTVLHLHDNDTKSDLHVAPYTCKTAGHNNITHWNGLLRGLRKIGYRGSLNFETFAAFMNTPKEATPALLQYIAAVGNSFRNKILGEEEI